MNDDALKLTIYAGERARADGGFVADALTAIAARHRLHTSLVLRGALGFGAAHGLRTDRLLTLSEDLPVVSVAVDTRPRILAALEEVERLAFPGLVTLERARMLTGALDDAARLPWAGDADTKLTVYVGRQARADGRPAYEAVTALLHARGIGGATALLGVDGTAHGERERARFFGRNAAVPVMVIAVGDTRRILAVLPELGALLPRPLATLERVRVVRRDGEDLADPGSPPPHDPSGLGMRQKLMVHTSERTMYEGSPVHAALVRELRRAGAAGATSLRGIWGFHGDHAPHGDVFWQLRRRVPVVTVVVDAPERARRWLAIAARVTRERGLVTSEWVPVARPAR